MVGEKILNFLVDRKSFESPKKKKSLSSHAKIPAKPGGNRLDSLSPSRSPLAVLLLLAGGWLVALPCFS